MGWERRWDEGDAESRCTESSRRMRCCCQYQSDWNHGDWVSRPPSHVLDVDGHSHSQPKRSDDGDVFGGYDDPPYHARCQNDDFL